MGIKIIVACSALFVRGQLKLSAKRWYSMDSMDVNLSKLQETVKEGQTEPGRLQSRESLRVAHDLATEQQHVDISTLRIWCPVSAWKSYRRWNFTSNPIEIKLCWTVGNWKQLFCSFLFAHFCSLLILKKPNCRNKITKQFKLNLDMLSWMYLCLAYPVDSSPR